MSLLNIMRCLVLALLCIAFSACAAAPIAQQGNTVPKVALLIGNAAYQQDRYSLKNPINDIDLIAQSLRKLGFAITRHTNLGRVDMQRAASDFAASVPAGATTFIYYAGHGMQVGGESYLIPTDMPLTSEQAVAIRAVPLASYLEKISASKASVNVVVLDACRNNPYQPTPAVRYRGGANLGLAAVKAPRGTFVAFSTSPNQQAPDGVGSNSTYAKALAANLLQPDQTLHETFVRVGEQVRKATYDDQIPWVASSLAEDYYFLPPRHITVVPGQGLSQQAAVANEGKSRGTVPKAVPAWHKELTEREWTELDWEIQQRVKRLTYDELPALERKAVAGNVVAQTTLGLVWREGIHKSTISKNQQVLRYGANNTKAVKWLQQAANAGFAVAQVELAEMYFVGHGLARDVDKAKTLLGQAAEVRYPRAQLDLAQIGLEAGEGAEALIKAISSVIEARP
ncbi:hypothetical protein AEP_00651 [Curvibacter sp. AEP1-3]|uniref:caspase family protein n=1 Tax=Curvibacter sp. AEP1-3 TaxID=1844971 RepID=UPI000B3C1296|nr:caspase family protein [Curvibacter sp. AEP1-3]ARV17611.1 hypothetical protein AEP_00651 [Curvibacter sp. AEP1-3]